MEYVTHLKRWRGPKGPWSSFQAIAETLEELTSYWNHINEIYSDIKQGDDKSID